MHGSHVLVVTSVKPKRDNMDVKGELEIKNLTKSAKQGYVFAFLFFLKFLKQMFQFKPELIFFPVWDPYSIFMLIFKWLPLFNYRYVIGCHGADVMALYPNSSYPVKPIFKRMGILALKKADLVFAISRFTANKLQKLNIQNQKIKIFPNGVDYTRFISENISHELLKQKYGLPDGNYPVLLTVAQLNKRKGIDIGIQLLLRLKKDMSKAIYIVIGDGPEEKPLRKLIAENNLNDSVFILNSIGDDELVEFYNLCDVFLLLSRHEGDLNVEGFGIVILEANACGKPAIGGDSGGIPDAIEDGQTGFIVDPLDIDKIHDKVVFLLDNPEIRSQMGSTGRRRVIEELNWGVICQNMLKTINESIFNET
jgi:phosphatidylinositol alpha-1,6-mannosyltransferase